VVLYAARGLRQGARSLARPAVVCCEAALPKAPKAALPSGQEGQLFGAISAGKTVLLCYNYTTGWFKPNEPSIQKVNQMPGVWLWPGQRHYCLRRITWGRASLCHWHDAGHVPVDSRCANDDRPDRTVRRDLPRRHWAYREDDSRMAVQKEMAVSDGEIHGGADSATRASFWK
jgi:hypothetical protein